MTLKIVVGIPTVGRAGTLQDTLRQLHKQVRPPMRIIVCGVTNEDVHGASDLGVDIVLAEPGLPKQRNAIIDLSEDADVVLFFDDDFLPDPNYLVAIEKHMISNPETAVATGKVIADGINGPGYSPAEGRAILATKSQKIEQDLAVFTGYGCNMAVRLNTMRKHHIRFDERLPLYGWQEDVDLSRQLSPFGNIIRVGDAKGVHLGVKTGRNSGLKLGYSQVANPLYLSNKKCGYPQSRAFSHIMKNVAMNATRSIWPEAYVDRRGRLRGNFLAVKDLLAGRLAPERILDF